MMPATPIGSRMAVANTPGAISDDQVYDPLRCSVAEEFRGLGQVVHSQRIETHKMGAGEIAGNWIISHHDPAKIARRTMQWPVALHANNSVSDDKVRGNCGVDVEDTSIDAPPVEGILRPSVRDAWHDAKQILHAQCDARPVVCFNLRHRNHKVAIQDRPWQPQEFETGESRLERHLHDLIPVQIHEPDSPLPELRFQSCLREDQHRVPLVTWPFAHHYCFCPQGEEGSRCNSDQPRVRVHLATGDGLNKIRLKQNGLAP
jgi:hypothetical protein